MLTRRGWSFVGVAAGLYLGGRLLGLVQLAVLAVASRVAAGGRVPVGPAHEARARCSADLEGAVTGRSGGPRRPHGHRHPPRPDDRDLRRVRPGAPGRPLPARTSRRRRRGPGRVPVPDRSPRPVRDRPVARHAHRSVRARRVEPPAARNRAGDRVPARARDRGAARRVRARPRPRPPFGTTTGRVERRLHDPCASTRPATTCATCTGGRLHVAGN